MSRSIAAIFDMDGVVVNTVDSLYTAYAQIVASLGGKESRSEFNQLNGCNLDEIVSLLIEHHHFAARGAEIKKRFERSFSSLYDRAELVPGIVGTLERLKNEGTALCMASAASRTTIDAVLGRFDLSRFFDCIVSGDEVKQAKPNPDIYRLAKSRCGRDENFVIEDSANGIDAARRAGLVSILYDPRGDANVENASYKVADLSEVVRIIIEDKAIIVSKADRIEIKQDDSPAPTSAWQERRADELWEEALRARPSMFNGDVASYRSHQVLPNGELVISCSRSQYKYVFARVHDARVKLAAPIGVSAAIVDKSGKALLGKRSESVSEYPGRYEFVPSGGVSLQNMMGTAFLEQLKSELEEETGISPARIQSATPLGLVYDRSHGVFDIGVKLRLDSDIDLETLTSTEYGSFIVLDYGQLQQFVLTESIVPPSEALLRVMIGTNIPPTFEKAAPNSRS